MSTQAPRLSLSFATRALLIAAVRRARSVLRIYGEEYDKALTRADECVQRLHRWRARTEPFDSVPPGAKNSKHKRTTHPGDGP